MSTTHPDPATAEPNALPTADHIVRDALAAGCRVLREQCSPQQRDTLDGLLSAAPLDRLAEQQLRQNYDVLRRVVTRNRDAGELADILSYTILFTWPRPPLSRNGGRGNPIARSRVVKDVRKMGWALAKQQRIPTHDHIVVRLHYAPGRRQQQDPMNWTDTTKAIIDGLRDAGVVPDDDTRHVTELEPEILFPPEPGPRCWLTITAV